MPRKGSALIIILGIIALVAIAALGVWYFAAHNSFAPSGVACTQEAKECPDGSWVGRTGPNCAFAPCPNGASSM